MIFFTYLVAITDLQDPFISFCFEFLEKNEPIGFLDHFSTSSIIVAMKLSMCDFHLIPRPYVIKKYCSLFFDPPRIVSYTNFILVS